jgi:hypothetical protein
MNKSKPNGGEMKSPETRLEKTKRRLYHILNDNNFYMNDGYREFVTSMHDAIGSRKVTPKMEISMDKVVAVYKKYLKSDNKLTKWQKKELIDSGVAKIELIRTQMHSCKYSGGYLARSDEFLDNVRNYLERTGKLSLKQKKALNQMYKRFTKKLESMGISDVQITMK